MWEEIIQTTVDLILPIRHPYHAVGFCKVTVGWFIMSILACETRNNNADARGQQQQPDDENSVTGSGTWEFDNGGQQWIPYRSTDNRAVENAYKAYRNRGGSSTRFRFNGARLSYTSVRWNRETQCHETVDRFEEKFGEVLILVTRRWKVRNHAACSFQKCLRNTTCVTTSQWILKGSCYPVGWIT